MLVLPSCTEETHVCVRNPNGPLAPRIHQHIEYLTRLRSDPSEEPNRKRGLPPEPTDGLDQAKRVRLGAEIKAEPDVQFEVASLPPGPVTLRQVFSLTKDEATNSFDVQQLPVELVQRVTIGVLEKIDDKRLHAAVQVGGILFTQLNVELTALTGCAVSP